MEYLCYARVPENYAKHIRRGQIRRWAEKKGLVHKGDGTQLHSDDFHKTDKHIFVLTEAQHVATHREKGWGEKRPGNAE